MVFVERKGVHPAASFYFVLVLPSFSLHTQDTPLQLQSNEELRLATKILWIDIYVEYFLWIFLHVSRNRSFRSDWNLSKLYILCGMRHACIRIWCAQHRRFQYESPNESTSYGSLKKKKTHYWMVCVSIFNLVEKILCST